MTSFCISLAHHLQHAEHADHPDDQSMLFAGLQPLYDSMPAQWASNDSSGHVYNSKNACAYAKLTIYLHTDSCMMLKKKFIFVCLCLLFLGPMKSMNSPWFFGVTGPSAPPTCQSRCRFDQPSDVNCAMQICWC